jgi:hypothetical protein
MWTASCVVGPLDVELRPDCSSMPCSQFSKCRMVRRIWSKKLWPHQLNLHKLAECGLYEESFCPCLACEKRHRTFQSVARAGKPVIIGILYALSFITSRVLVFRLGGRQSSMEIAWVRKTQSMSPDMTPFLDIFLCSEDWRGSCPLFGAGRCLPKRREDQRKHDELLSSSYDWIESVGQKVVLFRYGQLGTSFRRLPNFGITGRRMAFWAAGKKCYDSLSTPFRLFGCASPC